MDNPIQAFFEKQKDERYKDDVLTALNHTYTSIQGLSRKLNELNTTISNGSNDSKRNARLMLLVSLASACVALVSACFLYFQVSIAKDSNELAIALFESEKSPLVSISVRDFVFDSESGHLGFNVMVTNEGSVPVETNAPVVQLSFEALDSMMIEKQARSNSGILFPKDSIRLWEESSYGWTINAGVNPIIIVNVNFSSIYDSNSMFCFQRIFEYNLTSRELLPRILTPECNEHLR